MTHVLLPARYMEECGRRAGSCSRVLRPRGTEERGAFKCLHDALVFAFVFDPAPIPSLFWEGRGDLSRPRVTVPPSSQSEYLHSLTLASDNAAGFLSGARPIVFFSPLTSRLRHFSSIAPPSLSDSPLGAIRCSTELRVLRLLGPMRSLPFTGWVVFLSVASNSKGRRLSLSI